MNSNDELLTNLQILGKATENTKLCIRNNSLCLESNTYKNAFAKKTQEYLNTMKRWYFQDGRNTLIIFIQNIMYQVFTNTYFIMTNNQKEKWIFEQYLINLDNSLPGLESMKLTYKDDANICCKIDRIIINVSNHIEIMNKFTFSSI